MACVLRAASRQVKRRLPTGQARTTWGATAHGEFRNSVPRERRSATAAMLLASYMALGDRPRDTRNRGTARTRDFNAPRIEAAPEGLRIGVGVVIARLLDDALAASVPLLRKAALSFGTQQIRNSGNRRREHRERSPRSYPANVSPGLERDRAGGIGRRRPPLHAAARFPCRARSDRHRARGPSRRRDRAARRGLSGLCHGRSAQRAILPPSRMAFHHPSGDTRNVAGASGRGLPCRS